MPLAAAVEKCNRALNGVSVEAIRSDDQFRHSIANSMKTVQGQLAGMMIGAPIRRLRKVGSSIIDNYRNKKNDTGV
ncbi:hypothetical protein [Candidatus Kuenenia stuttgartiensis]|uniref:hypothetical protein n=1 Tax=Kuenenia stuttgartiensis TaxID=174633 RepID=UPI00146D6853|nr:hypothetical protein [Candidatus Kuenenia stuttgartiensis]